jgi:toxin YhaV
LRAADPIGYRVKKKTKLLAAILKMAFEVIPNNPADRPFWQGNTLGASYRHWHRGKFFEGRYRLFFRYATREKTIVLPWVNDEESLRTYESIVVASKILAGETVDPQYAIPFKPQAKGRFDFSGSVIIPFWPQDETN